MNLTLAAPIAAVWLAKEHNSKGVRGAAPALGIPATVSAPSVPV